MRWKCEGKHTPTTTIVGPEYLQRNLPALADNLIPAVFATPTQLIALIDHMPIVKVQSPQTALAPALKAIWEANWFSILIMCSIFDTLTFSQIQTCWLAINQRALATCYELLADPRGTICKDIVIHKSKV
jgi:hypothetical protein